MELEKIVSTVLEKVGKTDVSKETVKTLISLKPVPEGEEPDDKYFDEVVKAVKSVQGNLNSTFSTKLKEQVDAKVNEYKEKHPEHKDEHKEEHKEDDDKDMPQWAKELKESFEKEREERQREKAERAKKNLLDSVSQGLKDKFAKADMTVNSFFLGTALRELNIPEKDADVDSLIEEAEKIYTRNQKAAGIDTDAPHNGNGGGQGKPEDDSHMWDDIKQRRARYNPNPAKE